jgi:hypothetical protein
MLQTKRFANHCSVDHSSNEVAPSTTVPTCTPCTMNSPYVHGGRPDQKADPRRPRSQLIVNLNNMLQCAFIIIHHYSSLFIIIHHQHSSSITLVAECQAAELRPLQYQARHCSTAVAGITPKDTESVSPIEAEVGRGSCLCLISARSCRHVHVQKERTKEINAIIMRGELVIIPHATAGSRTVCAGTLLRASRQVRLC